MEFDYVCSAVDGVFAYYPLEKWRKTIVAALNEGLAVGFEAVNRWAVYDQFEAKFAVRHGPMHYIFDTVEDAANGLLFGVPVSSEPQYDCGTTETAA